MIVAERNEKRAKKGRKAMDRSVVFESSLLFSAFFVLFGYEFLGCGRRPLCDLCALCGQDHCGLLALERIIDY